MKMEDYELSEDSCPKCGKQTRYITCNQCDNGSIDVSEDDFEVEGTSLIRCPNCMGKGIEHWCPSCGYDLIFNQF